MMADARERLDVWRNVFLKVECAEKYVGLAHPDAAAANADPDADDDVA